MQLDVEGADSREVAARPGETGNRIVADDESDRDRGCRAFRRPCRWGADHSDHIGLAIDEIRDQRGELIV